MLNGLNFILLHVSDIAKVLPFYTQTLGFEIESQATDFVQFKLVNGQGAALALSQQEPNGPTQNIELWWFVDNAETTLASLQERGASLLEPLADQPFGRTFSLKDPLGNPLFFLQLRQSQA